MALGVPLWVPLWVRSAQRRPATALALGLVAALTVATAVSGPLLLRAVSESGLRQAVLAAGSATDIAVTTQADRDPLGADYTVRARRLLVQTLTDIAATASPAVFAPPSISLQSAEVARWESGPAAGDAPLVAPQRPCDGFAITRGRCPAGDGEAAVSTLTRGLAIGQRVSVAAPGQAGVVQYTIVGAYDATRSGPAVATSAEDSGAIRERYPDPILVAPASLEAFTVPVLITARDHVLPSQLVLSQVPVARASVARVQQQVINAQAGAVSFTSGLPVVLDAFAADQRAATAIFLVASALAIALALASAAGVMALVARVRTAEWALARMRGTRRRTWLGLVFAEPVALIAIGAVAGTALAWLGCRLTIGVLLPDRPDPVPVELLRLPVLGAGAAATAGLILATIIASQRSARAPLATLLREGSDPPRASRFVVAAESMVIVLAVAAGVQLAVQDPLTGATGVLALLAPGLIAAALALIFIRAGAGLVRRRARTAARSVTGLLVTRSLARAPSLLQRQVPVAIGVALLVFATQLALLSHRNQQLRAGAIVGASTVLQVKLPAGADLRSVVDAADPGGAQAMAVQERDTATDTGTSRVVAVDAARLAAVSSWTPSGTGLSAARLAAALQPREHPSLILHGSRVTVSLAAASVTPDAGSASPTDAPAQAALVLVIAPNPVAPWQRINLGTLAPGPQTMQTALPCRAGCRLVRWEIQSESPTAYDADLTIAALSTDQQPVTSLTAPLRDGSAWSAEIGTPEPGQPPPTSAQTSPAGLQIRAVTYPGDVDAPAVAFADRPDPLPAVVADGAQAAAVPGYPGTVQGTGLDGVPRLLKVTASAPVLPRALADGVLVDLSSARALADPAHEQLTSEVWLAAGAGPELERRLSAQGVTILSRQRAADAADELAEAATARAPLAVLAVGALALVLLVVVLLGSRIIDAERRRTLWLSGRLSGLSRARLARIVIVEIGAPAGLAVIVGAISGLAAILLAGTRLPLFAAGTVGPPLDVVPAWTPAGLLVMAVLGLIGLSAVLAAGLEARAR